MARTSEHYIIVGAGLGGSLLACLLAQDGHKVDVYERRPDPRVKGFIGGRSINLALSTRGITALEQVGLADTVLHDAVRMPGRMMHAPTGELTFQPYSAHAEDAINSVSRATLNITLLEHADTCDRVTLHFDQRCTGVNLATTTATFHDERTDTSRSVTGDAIIGADGAFSAVRDALRVSDRFNYSQSYLEHGYKELEIPPAKDCGVDPARHDGFAMAPNALHIWPRGGAMMIALPNQDRTFTCTLFWPFEDLEALDTDDKVRAHFGRHYADAVPLMPTLVEDYRTNPSSSLVTIRCEPWNRGRVLLIGDAAHAVVPFYGQGMNASFEDARILAEMLRTGDAIEGVFEAFSRERKDDADAIADLAIENFLVMRDRVADKAFLFRKRVEQALDRVDPKRFTPLYNLVSFSNMPYAEARIVGGRVVELAERLAGELRKVGAESLDDAALTERVRSMVATLPATT
ncbi:MAG: NAD(P)/FAD-dependent oxidoreductase [Phycisphaerales bacterium]